MSFVGEVTGDGYMKLVESKFDAQVVAKRDFKRKLPYDLHLEAVLGVYIALRDC